MEYLRSGAPLLRARRMPADRPALLLMNQKLIDYARAVAAAANQDRLDAGHAILFCKEALPLLLAEIDVADLLHQRFDALMQQPMAEPVEAPARTRRRPSKKARRRKGGRA